VTAAILLLVLAGCKSRQLATPTVQMDVNEQLWVRILLLDDVNACTLKMNGPFSVLDGRASLQAQTAAARFEQPNLLANITVVNGDVEIAGQTFTDEQIVILPDEPHIFNLNGNSYRGKLKLILSTDRGSFDAINVVPP